MSAHSIVAKPFPVPATADPAPKPIPKHGNPAVVGLAGFGLSTLLLQFHNVGWVGIGPVVWLGLVFGGAAQMIAGLQEMKAGNNFGYSAFTSYGCFWIALGLMQIGNATGLFTVTETDVGWYLVVWTLYTAVMTVGALRISTVLGLVFITLLIGFVLLDLAHFMSHTFTVLAGYELMVCAGLALYGMAHAVFLDVFGRDVLPMGKPIIS
ncbi:GPR1/FUN34/YaaH family transporter [Azospirillum sp. TSO22-1]|uniref:acetate uptake transporter n=1 Tax=Azospirillum sp. TSO22-1 TaxID=716789 RepID=UPI000D64E57F|nr:GPR1/FUN34/YaaH family transporter [Azospirillum sp. TSO22-1]